MAEKKQPVPESHRQAERMGIKPKDTYTCRMVNGHSIRRGHANKPVVIESGTEFLAEGHEIAGLGFRVEVRLGREWQHFPTLVAEKEAAHRGELRARSSKIRADAARLHRAILAPQSREAIEAYPLPTHLTPYIPTQAQLDKARAKAEKKAGLQAEEKAS